MKQNIETIDYDWLTKPTGDPFADTGGFVIQYLWEHRFPDKDIDELIEFVTKIYVDDWDGKLHTFFHGSKITNPAIKTSKDKLSGTKRLFQSFLNETAEHIEGNCRISSRYTKLFSAGRESLILSGSGAFINFHHFFQSGLFLSKEMLIRMFFIPFGTQLLSGKLTVIQCSITEFAKFYVFENCSLTLRNISNLKPEVLRSEFNKPSNAIFDFIQKLIYNKSEIVDKEIAASLTLYHGSNFGASTEMNVYNLPSTVFHFYILCQKLNYKQDWQMFINSHYYNSKSKGAVYNSKTGKIELTKKTEQESFDYNEFKLWTNWILNKLLDGKSIIHDFLKWSKKGNKLNIDIVKIYLLNITKMKKETVKKITELADFIVRDKNELEIQKRIKKLNGAKNSFLLRRFFINDMVAKNHKDGNEKPIITVDDYANYLFSDSSGWQEIRDVLLIAVYQKLHELNLNIQVDIEEEIENKVEQTNNE